MKLLGTIGKEKLYVLGDQVVVSGSAFVTNLLLARALGLQQYGIFSGLGMVQLFLLSISMAFSSQVYQVVFPGLHATARKAYTNGLLYLQLIITVLLLISSLLFFLWMPDHGMITGSVAGAAAIATGLYLLQDFLRKALLTCGKVKEAFYGDLITNILQLLLLAMVWALHSLTLLYAWLIIGLTFIPSVIAAFWWLQPGFPGKKKMLFALRLQKNKSPWLISSALLQWSSGYFFVVAAGWWVGAAALGAFRLAQYIFGLLNVLLQAIENYTLPRASASYNKTAYLKALLKKCLLLMLPVLLLLAVLGKPVLQLAGGNGYSSYGYLMYGLAIIYVVITIGYPVRIAIRSLHLNRVYFTGYILSVIFCVSTAPWLLLHWQLYGALTGILCTQMITIGYWVITLQRKKFLSWKLFTWS